MTLDESQLEKAVVVMEEAQQLVMACHVGPDGDALGSMLGMALAAKAAGKTVAASFGTPFEIPPQLEFLPTGQLIPPGELPKAPEVFVAFDSGSPDRLGDLAATAQAARSTIVIDHHVTNTGFGDVQLVDPSAAASAEICIHLLERLRWPITPDIALCLLTALMTDTGRFQYSNTTAATLRAAAKMVDAGARPEIVGRHVYEEASFTSLHVMAAVLGRAVLEPELALVWSYVTDEDINEAGADWGEVDSMIDAVRVAEEADTAVLIKVFEVDRSKVSLRSRGGTDVGSLASALGGGGHRNASGFTTPLAVDEIMARVRDLLEKHR
jgi:phosphoesterase RecJ-like protein